MCSAQSDGFYPVKGFRHLRFHRKLKESTYFMRKSIVNRIFLCYNKKQTAARLSV